MTPDFNIEETTLISLIREGSTKSKNIRDLIQTAKTKTKRKFYSKKLKKHNLKMAKLIMKLELIQTLNGNTQTDS